MQIKMVQLNRKALAYAATSLGSSMMTAVFNFYYVKIFLNYYHVSQGWFQISQVIFMGWNAINDPLFGYIQDNMDFSFVRSRRHSILYGAPFFAISFLVPWFPWGDYFNTPWLAGLHLLLALCLWDTLFTFVLLAQCALFAEISSKHEDRLLLVRYSQIGSLIGSSSVFFCELVSKNLDNFFLFQLTCIIIAVLAWLCMRYTGNHCITDYEPNRMNRHDSVLLREKNPTLDDATANLCTMWRQIVDIFKQRSFVSFVLVNFCQIYHSTFLANFTAIIHEQILGKDFLSATIRSGYYGLMGILPQVML